MCNVIYEKVQVGTPKFDLQKEFDDANQKYFDGKLKPIPLEYRTLTNSFGKVNFYSTTQGKKVIHMEPIKLSMNKKYNYTREQFLSTFLHELCHLYMVQNYRDYTWRGGYHGSEWTALANEISQKSGVPITVKKYSKDYDYAEPPKDDMIIVIKKYASGNYGIGYTSATNFAKHEDVFRRGFGFPMPESVLLVRGSDRFVKQYATKSVRTMKFYKIDPGAMNDFLRDSENKVFDVIKFK